MIAITCSTQETGKNEGIFHQRRCQNSILTFVVTSALISGPWDVEVVSKWQCGLGFSSCCDLVTPHGDSCLTGSQAMARYGPKRKGRNILAICHRKCSFGYCWQDCTDECSQFSGRASVALFGLEVTTFSRLSEFPL